jgi:lambda family phage minor tail protein L
MALDRSFDNNADLQGLSGDAIIDLYELDLLPIDPTIPAASRFFRFVNWVIADGITDISYGGEVYTPLPVIANGFELRAEGVPPSPAITIGNIGLEMTALVNTWDDLVGARLRRRRVLRRYLDDQSTADPTAHWPDEIWVVQQKDSENKLAVTFKLSTAFDLDGVRLPGRRALRFTCPWVYRGVECGYSGGAVATAKDVPTANLADDVCGKRLSSCRLRYGSGDLPYGGFPGLQL